MKKLIVLFLTVTIAIACKTEEKKEVKKEKFPEALGKVFEKHGGIDNWRKAETLSFNIGEEVHTVDLHSRKTVINTPKYSLGFDGKEVWLSEQDTTAFKKDPKFYYNLYFYFYAMPFVLADDGIVYEKIKALTYKDVEYPGYKISYNANIGTSPDDNYFVYYNPETYQMEWLAYTVTYFTKKTSDKFNILRYDSWENVNGLILPGEITWYKKDDSGLPTEPASEPTKFTLALISQGKLGDAFFAKPAE